MKKNINTVIRTIQRIGRPRAMYEAMASTVVLADGDNVLKTRSYLLTWDQFMAEVNCSDLPLEKCKEIVAAIVDTHGIATAKTSTDSEKIVTEGLLAGISLKQMELCHEKCDVLHRLRLAVTCNEESRILQFIQRNCKGTGPDAHPSRRDITMPVWWTKHHDLHLLRLVLEQGLGQWKNLAVNNVVSSSLPNFVMPTRVQGVEWSLALTAKNVEKRFNDLYKTLQNSIPVEQLPPGSPSDSLTKAKVAKPFFASSSSTKPPQPSVSQPSVPVTATQPSVPVTATQPSVPVTATQPSVPVTATQPSFPVMATPVDKVSTVHFEDSNVIDLITESVSVSSPVVSNTSTSATDSSVSNATASGITVADATPTETSTHVQESKQSKVVAPSTATVTPGRDISSIDIQQISPTDVITMANASSAPPDAKENSKPSKATSVKAAPASKKKVVPAVASGNIMSFFNKVPKPVTESAPPAAPAVTEGN
jgi:hypothetical protein